MLLSFSSAAQSNPYWQEPTKTQVDSLKKVLAISTNDSVNMYINRQLGMYYQEINRMASLTYYEEMLRLATKIKQKVWEAEALSRNGYVSCLIQNYSGGLKFLLMARTLASQKDLEKEMWNPGLLSKRKDAYDVRITILAAINEHLGIIYNFSGEYSKALDYYRNIQKINEILNDTALMSLLNMNMGEAYSGLMQLDSAEAAFKKSIYFNELSGYKKYKGITLYDIGKIYEKRDNNKQAKKYYGLSIKTNIETESPDSEGMGYQALADIFKKEGNIDSALFFSRQALKIYQQINDTLGLIAAYSSLSSGLDDSHQMDSAYQYLKKAISLKEALNKEGRIKSFQLAGFNEQLKLEEQKVEQLRTITRIRTWSFVAGIAALLFMSGIFYRNYRRQRKDKTTIENAFADLKSTQNQLIQKEKLASLGELTAGIAHEIQNPLNFVNNFSELSVELAQELKEEVEKQKIDKELVSDLVSDLTQNQEKINLHGKRAASIVKGMLEHSRTGAGERQLTDINQLADEYLRLSYHGLRSKDSLFNSDYELITDESLPKTNVVPQEIGRVLLNLINNAFYAVNERSKLGEADYQPKVTVTTQLIDNQVKIAVQDNGMGMSDATKAKIFQPFFTTKPTGEGTGLGLSLAYDIVTKGHNGAIETESVEGQGTTFVVKLPFDKL
jgi:two-component system NtrC family sensor kinase